MLASVKPFRGRRRSLAPGQRWCDGSGDARRRFFVDGPASGAGSLHDGRSWFPRKRPVARQAGGLAGDSRSSGISMGVVAVDRVEGLDGALLLAGAVGSLVSQCWETRASDART